MDPERQQPIETYRHPFFQQVKYRTEPENKNTPGCAGDRFGFLERRAEDQDRDGEQLEDAEPDGRGRVENVGDRGDSERHGQELQAPAHVAPGQRAARPGKDDEEPGKEMLGYRPGDSGQVCRKAKKSFDADELTQVIEKVIADHQDDRKATQEINLPDASRNALLTHSARIVRSTPQRQGKVKIVTFQISS